MAQQQADKIIIPKERDVVKYRVEKQSQYIFDCKASANSKKIFYSDLYAVANPADNAWSSLKDYYDVNDMISNGYILYPSGMVGTYGDEDIEYPHIQSKTNYTGFSESITFTNPMIVFNPDTNTYFGLMNSLNLTIDAYSNYCYIDGLPVRYELGTSEYVDKTSIKILLAYVSSARTTQNSKNAALDRDACRTEAMYYRSRFRDVYNYLISLPYGATYVHPYIMYIDDDPNRGGGYRRAYHPATEYGTGSIDNIRYWSSTRFILPFASENEFHASGCANGINYEMLSTDTKNKWDTISNYDPN